MAERRMFHASVVGSDAFMDLPAGAQALYFHLGMQADDDGFVNCPRQVARRLRRPLKELQLLVDKGFLLDFAGIVILRHWLVGNTLKTDRMKALSYPDIAQKLYVTPNREYTLQQQEKSKSLVAIRTEKMESKRNPKVREGKVREGKVSQEKIRKDKVTQVSVSEEKCPSAENADRAQEDSAAAAEKENVLKRITGKLGKGVVFLTEEQMGDLLDRMDIDGFDFYVGRLADYILKNRAHVSNHYATILKWWEEDKGVRA